MAKKYICPRCGEEYYEDGQCTTCYENYDPKGKDDPYYDDFIELEEVDGDDDEAEEDELYYDGNLANSFYVNWKQRHEKAYLEEKKRNAQAWRLGLYIIIAVVILILIVGVLAELTVTNYG